MSHLRDSKFIISCAARSGSTMLVHLLRSHPEVVCHGEVFEPSRIGQLDGNYALRRRLDPANEGRLMAYRSIRPDAFLYDVVFDTQGHRAVGFKFKSDEAFDPAYRDIADLIYRDTDIKILHLRRRNILDQYVSHQVVLQQSGVTLVAHDSAQTEPRPFVIDVKDLAEYALDVIHRERRAAAVYAAHRQGVVDYEALVDSDPATRNRMQTFLGLNCMPLSTPTRKIIKRNADLVENLEEVMAAMASKALAHRCIADPVVTDADAMRSAGTGSAMPWAARLWRRAGLVTARRSGQE